MSLRKSRTIVTAISVVVAFGSITLVVYFRIAARPNPLWNQLLLTYGIVFCLFLAMDRIGRQASRLRTDADERRPRPRPTPPSAANSARAVVLPGVSEPMAAQITDVSLERVRMEHADLLQRMVDIAFHEVLALDNKRPQIDQSGHVQPDAIRSWLTDGKVFPFFVTYQGKPIGCCVLRAIDTVYGVEMFYIESGWRRHGAGTAAMHRISEFVRMVGDGPSLQIRVSASNGRAQRFLQSFGYQKLQHGVLASAAPEFTACAVPDEAPTERWLLQVDEVRS